LDTSTLLKVFGFVEPKIVTVAEEGNIGEYLITPLKEGFGTTVGNSLRRTLLSSLPGAAITEVKIDGVSHEFSTIKGVREDVLELTLNLKKIRIQIFEGESATLTLQAKGVKTIKASDFKAPSSVSIVNPDTVIMHLTDDKAAVNAECKVERGVKFLIHQNAEAKKKDIGTVPIDAIFSPVLNVEYSVTPTRVGKATNYDELRIKITTDGTIKPKDALVDSAKIINAYARLLANEDNFDLPVVEAETRPVIQDEAKHTVTLEDLNLSTRTRNSLAKNNITSIEQILNMDEEELLRLKNFGQKALSEIREELEAHGITNSNGIGGEEALVNPEELDIL